MQEELLGASEYEAWLKKFETKKTTDSCFTPAAIYSAVSDWAVNEYGLKGRRILRPFHPEGDYEKMEYQAGSKSANHYYANVTRMTNSLLGIESGERDNLDANQLKQVAILEGVVDIAIRDGVKAEMPYKDIYQLAKERASHVVKAVGVIGGEL